jgi:hypothetical protein
MAAYATKPNHHYESAVHLQLACISKELYIPAAKNTNLHAHCSCLS